jgi:diguanylate cyclase (GGDEF)-like protein
MNRPSRPPVVLIASDQEWSARSLESVLGPRGYAVLRAGTGQRTLELARIAQPDAYIVDAGMSDIRGVELCARLRQDPKFPLNVAIIMTTPSPINNRAERLEAYTAGAWELCAEPIDIDVLLLKLDAFVQAKLAADRVREESLVDEETGLYNVRGLARRAREIGGDATRRGDAVACVVFAPESDAAAGRPTTDNESPQVAEVVSRICRTSARASDAIGRLGPNEYAIIAPSTSAAGADRIVERLRDSFAATTVRLGDREHRFRFSAFVASVPNIAESSVDTLELLYSATASLRQARNSIVPPVDSGRASSAGATAAPSAS